MAKKLANDGDPEALAERGRRRMERATIRAMREVTAEERRRPQLQEDMAEDSVTVSVDLEVAAHARPRSATSIPTANPWDMGRTRSLIPMGSGSSVLRPELGLGDVLARQVHGRGSDRRLIGP